MSITLPETWSAIPGWEGVYEASDLGRVRSVDRIVHFRDGRRRFYRGNVLRPFVQRKGYPMVQLMRNKVGEKRYVHSLVLLAFDGVRPDGAEVCHQNGDPADNRLSNLRYDTQSANSYDSVRHGTHPQASKTHCASGHEFTDDNTYRPPKRPGYRVCRLCFKQQQRDSYQRRRNRAARIAS